MAESKRTIQDLKPKEGAWISTSNLRLSNKSRYSLLRKARISEVRPFPTAALFVYRSQDSVLYAFLSPDNAWWKPGPFRLDIIPITEFH